MGIKKGWFTCVRRLFNPESRPKSDEGAQEPKTWRWFLEKFKFRKHPSVEATHRMLKEAAKEQQKHAVAVAIATTAAAEAAVAAANAAAEVVRLTNIPQKLEKRTLHIAAIKIQTAYRGHLARKALSALKGMVKLQAVVRGELVRSVVTRKPASISPFPRAHPLFYQKRVPKLPNYDDHSEKSHILSQKEGLEPEELKLHSNSYKSWDYLSKQEAIAKMEPINQYSFSNQERGNDQSPQESMALRENRKIEHFEFVEHQQEETERLRPFSHSSNTDAIDTSRLAQLKLRTTRIQDKLGELNSPSSLPRRSSSQAKEKSITDDRSLPDSPVLPSYMAATESAKAKSRSLSTPKRHPRLYDSYSDQLSPHRLSLSSWSSLNSEMTNTNKRDSISQRYRVLGEHFSKIEREDD